MRILHNARIHTFVKEHPFATAIAIKDGIIKAVGMESALLPYAKTKKALFDLQGMTVLPGFCDSHIHLYEYGKSLSLVDCETKTRADCLVHIKEKVQRTPEDTWILGHGWNHNIWREGLGKKDDLDAISSQHPMYITAKSMHCAWVNSKALKLAGIDRNTPDPPGGKIERGAHGDATGILYESAVRSVEEVLPKPDQDQIQQTLLASQRALQRFGITSVHDVDHWDCYPALQSLECGGDLHLRVVKSIPRDQLELAIQSGLKTGLGSDWLQIGWLKLFMDGALGPQTAAMLEPYKGSKDAYGILALKKADLLKIGGQSLEAGIALEIHAIGDRANREALDALAELQELQERCTNYPSRIEHVQLIQPADQNRLAKYNITASMQPIHAISDMDMAERYWGERCSFAYAWQSLLNKGVRLVFGSDAPVETPNPFFGLHAAVNRKKLDAPSREISWHGAEHLTLEQALTAYILNPAEICGFRGKSGKLQVGFFADLVVLPADPYSLPSIDISALKPVATMTNGEWRYQEIDF